MVIFGPPPLAASILTNLTVSSGDTKTTFHQIEINLCKWQNKFLKFQNCICPDFCSYGQLDSEKAVSSRDSQTTHGGIGKKYGLQDPSRTLQICPYLHLYVHLYLLLYLHLYCYSNYTWGNRKEIWAPRPK